MEAAVNIHNLLENLSYQCLFLADIKHNYWAVNMYFDDCHYFIFHVSRIEEVQSTRMSQGARTSVFTFGKLMNIVLGPIPSPKLEPSLFHAKISKNSTLPAFYIDDIFKAFKTYQE